MGRCSSIDSTRPGSEHLQPSRHHVVPQMRQSPGGTWEHSTSTGPTASTAAAKSSAERIERLPDAVRPTERRTRPRRPTRHETYSSACDLDCFGVEVGQLIAGHLVPDRRDIDIAQGQQRVRTYRVEHFPVPGRHHLGQRADRVRNARPQVRFSSRKRRKSPDSRNAMNSRTRSLAEHPTQNPGRRVVVVHIVDQVAEYHQLFNAAGDVREPGDVAVDVGDEREPHGHDGNRRLGGTRKYDRPAVADRRTGRDGVAASADH